MARRVVLIFDLKEDVKSSIFAARAFETLADNGFMRPFEQMEEPTSNTKWEMLKPRKKRLIKRLLTGSKPTYVDRT